MPLTLLDNVAASIVPFDFAQNVSTDFSGMRLRCADRHAKLSSSTFGLSRRPMEHTSSQDVDMEVKDGLTGSRAVVNHNAITARLNSALVSEFCCNAQQVPNQSFIFGSHGIELLEVNTRHDQQVNRGLWMEVLNRDCAVVLIDDFARCFPPDDLTENATLRD